MPTAWASAVHATLEALAASGAVTRMTPQVEMVAALRACSLPYTREEELQGCTTLGGEGLCAEPASTTDMHGGARDAVEAWPVP
mmetsp:Transcript_130690/g.364154  ORF Transcript_130690/g.364154 Transcript_130690/m.364154 type:complete len:84 (+) Transcript_130690:130-381(+)